MSAPVKLWVTRYCFFCRAAEHLLREIDVPFEAVDVTDDRAARDDVVARSGWRTVPVIYVGDELVGGFRELSKLVRAGELQPLLERAGWQAA